MAIKEKSSQGTLYIVATPIGNLSDMSQRAIECLNSVDIVLAEDTRSFGKLAKRYDIHTKAKSYHEHNEEQQTLWAIEQLKNGKSIALTSDAGTPTISDPGYRLINASRVENIPISPIPGASAAIAALSVSGFPSDRFIFEGFLPRKKGKLHDKLKTAIESKSTTIFYESPFRIKKSLAIIKELAPEKEILIAREITKRYEEFIHGSATEVNEKINARTSIKGEIVLIVSAQ